MSCTISRSLIAFLWLPLRRSASVMLLRSHRLKVPSMAPLKRLRDRPSHCRHSCTSSKERLEAFQNLSWPWQPVGCAVVDVDPRSRSSYPPPW